jgi:catechol 2,3-dioxygenase-like lactoylglutathione lyase family enzyme
VSGLSLGVILLFTEDFDATVGLFRDDLGLTAVDDDPGAGYERGVDFLGLATGGPLLEVFDSAVHRSPAPELRSTAVLAFRTDDLVATMENLVVNGAEVVEDVVEREWGSYAYMRHSAGPAFQIYVERPRD